MQTNEITAYVRLSGFPDHIRRLGIETAVFQVKIPVALFAQGNDDGSMVGYAGVPAVPAVAEPPYQEPVGDAIAAPAAAAKRGRKKKDTADTSPPAVVAAPASAPPSGSGLAAAPMPLPSRASVSPQIVQGVRTFPAAAQPGEITQFNGAVELTGGAGVPVGSPIQIPGSPPMGPATWSGVAQWATPPQPPAPPQMSLTEIQGLMLRAFQTNAPAFHQAMQTAQLNPASITPADAAKVVAALNPILGQGG